MEDLQSPYQGLLKRLSPPTLQKFLLLLRNLQNLKLKQQAKRRVLVVLAEMIRCLPPVPVKLNPQQLIFKVTLFVLQLLLLLKPIQKHQLPLISQDLGELSMLKATLLSQTLKRYYSQ
ncbi:Uncharacterised protein [Chlamydia trachomatis]|nr:Uncharacterised protein [Chlamydia trachomatis]